MVRWTTDFDCKSRTGWWYVIKDTPFNINELKAKRRYEINKGKKNFEVKRIRPSDYLEELFKVYSDAIINWPEKYRPSIEKISFKREILEWENDIVYGGFERSTNKLCGYACLREYSHHLDFNMLRVDPLSEKRGINAAIISCILENTNGKLSKEFYINDGNRNIRHETAFQDYLEKYFGFRRAYCKLHIKYRFPVNIIVCILYPIRKKIVPDRKLGNLIMGVLKMEEIKREQGED